MGSFRFSTCAEVHCVRIKVRVGQGQDSPLEYLLSSCIISQENNLLAQMGYLVGELNDLQTKTAVSQASDERDGCSTEVPKPRLPKLECWKRIPNASVSRCQLMSATVLERNSKMLPPWLLLRQHVTELGHLCIV